MEVGRPAALGGAAGRPFSPWHYTGAMDAAHIRIIRASQCRRTRWKNGLGWTHEIVRVPDAEAWDWRLSIAEIECDAEFSPFPGIERELVLLSGNGVRLAFADGETHELLPPHDRLRFGGERAVRGELIDGPTRDFNLMWRRDRIRMESWIRPLVGTMVLFVEPGATWVVHLLAGRGDLDGVALEAGDTAILRADAARTRSVLDGGGEVLLARVAPRDDAQ